MQMKSTMSANLRQKSSINFLLEMKIRFWTLNFVYTFEKKLRQLLTLNLTTNVFITNKINAYRQIFT
jgi:hypothetical protein